MARTTKITRLSHPEAFDLHSFRISLGNTIPSESMITNGAVLNALGNPVKHFTARFDGRLNRSQRLVITHEGAHASSPGCTPREIDEIARMMNERREALAKEA